jgi:aspartyl-tRNA(Asn)/glutamyl-tRNA(Gln) amidotransferase subunit C
MELDVSTVKHMAHLSRLDLSEEELDRFRGQLIDILSCVEELAGLDLDAVMPRVHTVEVTNRFRVDHPQAPLGTDEALAGTADRQGDTFRVPVVVDTEDVLED